MFHSRHSLLALLCLWLPLNMCVYGNPAPSGPDSQSSPDNAAAEKKETRAATPRSRSFRFEYGATLNELPDGARVRVWVPVPQSSDHQHVTVLDRKLPAEGATAVEPTYGNKILYFETNSPASGSLTFSTSYLIHRNEVRGLTGSGRRIKLNDAQRARFLSANRKVPLKGRQLDLLEGIELSGSSLAIARTLYDQVDEHVRYDKSKPGYGNGDVLWVCDSRFGNCTDFHSLFISWARAKGLPARFEIGFPLPPKRGKGTVGGYHCWALFHSDQRGWVPVDISEADKHPEMKEYYFGNLTEDRITFTTGRDINLVPQQDGQPLNYFVYPYIEVDGKPWPKKKISLSFAYEDVDKLSGALRE